MRSQKPTQQCESCPCQLPHFSSEDRGGTAERSKLPEYREPGSQADSTVSQDRYKAVLSGCCPSWVHLRVLQVKELWKVPEILRPSAPDQRMSSSYSSAANKDQQKTWKELACGTKG